MGKNLKVDRGSLLVVLLFLVVIAALMGVWGLSSTRTGMVKAGHYRGSLKLQYLAEDALQKAVRRIQEISDPTLTDSLFTSGAYSPTERTISFLVDSSLFATESVAGIANPSCPEPFDPETGLDDSDLAGEDSNVICNFMGNQVQDTQVILVRKDDWVEGNMRNAVFLVNSVATDATGRKKLIQGVAILPYEGSAPDFSLPVGEKAYLATVVKSGGD